MAGAVTTAIAKRVTTAEAVVAKCSEGGQPFSLSGCECPSEGHELKQFRRNYSDPNRGPTGKGTARYRALKEVCQACPSKAKCCPNADARKITRE